MNKSQTLVSVVVITYNSSAFVLETLESARKQTYDQVELIITDDGSTDETISLCKEWLEINSARFIRVALLTVKENTGIPANCNRGVKAAKGEWVKLIAGDDILHENCITLNMEYVDKPEFAPCVVLSDMLQFSNSLDTEDTLKRIVPTNIEILTDNIASSIQHKYMLKHYIGNSPSMFISKLLLDEIPYDEEIRFMEDRPFAINLTARGFVFRYFKEVTVYYRISEQSVYASKAGNVLYND
jgi:glycosyltransferase involved in cell wall biosynthesis